MTTITESRDFHIGDILSVTTGRLLSPRGVGGVYDILNFMTSDTLYTHQLPRASDECRPELLRQHPKLVVIDASGIDRMNWRQKLAEWAVEFGETLSVSPLPNHAHEYIDPVSELTENVHPSKIIVVKRNER